MSKAEERFKKKMRGDGTEILIPPCNECQNRTGDLTCKAFPDEIPDIILHGKDLHILPLPGQKNDIVFERTK